HENELRVLHDTFYSVDLHNEWGSYSEMDSVWREDQRIMREAAEALRGPNDNFEGEELRCAACEASAYQGGAALVEVLAVK
ncbi:MAG: hypothetical protein VX670_11610, partial [Candidatus Latescibacterota bacterium]|nr:hypothetical protein [Candidatus Latescibacterota bacterium]